MDKQAVRATMLSLPGMNSNMRRRVMPPSQSAMIDRTEPARRTMLRWQNGSEIAEAFDQPVHTIAEKVEKLKTIDFGPKNRVAEGAIVKLNGVFLSSPYRHPVCVRRKVVHGHLDGCAYLSSDAGLRAGDSSPLGGHPFTIEQLG